MGNRTIRLCNRTDAISKDMPNFSKWIRRELIAWDDAEDRLYWKEKAESLIANNSTISELIIQYHPTTNSKNDDCL